MKLLRTIRLDPSDTFVFENAAEPGEWAVTGTFMFADDDPERALKLLDRAYVYIPPEDSGLPDTPWKYCAMMASAGLSMRSILAASRSLPT